MTDLDETSVLDLELRVLLATLERDDTPSKVRAPGRETRLVGPDDEIMVTVVTDPKKHKQVIKSLRSIKLKPPKEINVSGTKGVLLVTLPMGALRKVEKLTGIESVEAPAELLLPRLNRARSETGLTDAVRRYARNARALSGSPKTLTGKGVVIATVDSGLDWWHGDFRRPNGKTRVARYAWWEDESREDSKAEETGLRAVRKEPQYVYNADDINRALNGSQYIAHRDPKGHGTHCMSIAAGNGRASQRRKFQGVAPKATIMGLGTTRYTAAAVTWGIERFFEWADRQPAVISLSYGGHRGPHDGTSSVEKMIERQSGQGRIVVVAAGNEAEDGIHWQGKISTGEEAVISVRIGDDSYQWVEVWIPGSDKVEVLVETPDRAQYPPSLIDPHPTVFGEFGLNQGKQHGDTRVFLQIYNGRVNHTWRIRIRGIDVDNGQIHAWSGTDELATTYHLFLGAPTSDYTLGMPATVEEAIVVGSFVSQPEINTPSENIKTALGARDLSPFSSRGPTRKGLRKPDIVAPGQYITAALASDSLMATADRFRSRHREGSPYVALQGTSMSTPFVAGVVALMLQRCNNLTPKDVRELLTQSARTPKGRNPGEWDSGFGFGLLDTKELFKRLEGR